MGWFWDTKTANGSTEDPYSKLDPALRDFLDKESPLKYEDTRPSSKPQQPSAPSPDAASNTYRSQLGWTAPGEDQQPQRAPSQSDKPATPPESMFQDGRYAHLWKGYRPQAEIDAAGRNDQDKLRDVIDSYNDRKAAIGRAAIENCVLEQMNERDCWENGSWQERMNMCRGRNKQFLRCYTMQSRFLKALGYLSTMRSEEEEERIQMHADKLYHQMLDREAAVEDAKKIGQEAPELPPLISPETTSAALGPDSAWARARQKALEMGGTGNLSAYSPERQEQIKKQIEGLSERERELELQLIAAESRAQLEYAEQIRQRLDEERESRLERRGRGKETVGDTIKRLWGWDKGA
ncbi:hypothetical protein LTR85_002813 [Meristemomyces frigidus]|nr:hypothetical protein LTR85_002813 [Meristemomyces frigidus]